MWLRRLPRPTFKSKRPSVRGHTRNQGCSQAVLAGQSLVELALILPVLALLLLGVVDLGRGFFYSIRLSDAVKEGALYGVYHHTNVQNCTPTPCASADPNNVTFHTTFESSGNLKLQPSDVVVRCYSAATPSIPLGSCNAAVSGDTIEVRATYQFRPFTQQIIGIIGNSLPMTRTARMVIIQ